MKLFEFAFCPSFDRKISNLATICPEKWSFGANNDNVILKNYIQHTFMKIAEEDKIVFSDHHAVFNTGLFSTFYEPIFAIFQKIISPISKNGFWKTFILNISLQFLELKIYPKEQIISRIHPIWFLIQTVI